MTAPVPTPVPTPQVKTAKRIGPQPGPQEAFLRKRWVDLIIYGGAAGGGKSYALLLDAAWHACFQPVKGYGAVIFRRTSPQITQTGGLWETSQKIYPHAKGKPRQTPWLGWEWPQYSTNVRFSHLQHEDDKLKWQGAQIPYIAFDELTHFSESQFFYLLSRNRSPVAGVKPIMRATTNPDPESWVRGFLAPWVDDDYADPARSGEVRWFYRDGDTIMWLHAPSDRPDFIPRDEVYSVTFIEAHLEDNPALMEADPGYRGRIQAMPLVERIILSGGPDAWKVRLDGNMFKREWFKVVDEAPYELVEKPDGTTERKSLITESVRYWDIAATEAKPGTDPDYTVGVLLGRTSDGDYYVLDVARDRRSPKGVKALLTETGRRDGRNVPIRIEQEPGSSGKAIIDEYVTALDGYDVRGVRSTGSKETRAAPFSAQAEAGHVKIMRASWNAPYINELCAFPTQGIHDDQVDGSSGAHEQLRQTNAPRIRTFNWDD